EGAVLAVRRPLQEHRADALRDAAPDLALDDGGIDERAAVLDGDVPLYLHEAGLGIDVDDRAVRAAGPAAFAAVVRGLDLELGGPVTAAARCATSVTEMALAGSPRTQTLPSVIKRSCALTSMRSAAKSSTLAL